MSLEALLAKLENRQARLQARQDIWHTITRYARGIDEQRQDDLEAILTDDVELLTLPWSQHAGVGKAAVLGAFRTYQQTYHHPRRVITNEQIHVNDDGTATGYANVCVVQARDEQSYCGWGTYEWEFRYVGAVWKIRKMVIALDCMTTLERGWGMSEERILALRPRPVP